MANPILDALAAQVEANTDVINSAVILINGIHDRIQAAVDAALKNGATEAELLPVQAEVDAMRVDGQKLADAVAQNTPAMAKKKP